MPPAPNHLRAWREFRGLTQEQVADLVGTDKTQISKLEKGLRRLTTDWLDRFERAFGAPRAQLLDAPPAGPERAAARLPAGRQIVTMNGAEFAALPVLDVRAAAGFGARAIDETPSDWFVLGMNWVRAQTRAPLEALHIIRVAGDSMEPSLYDGDLICIDRRRTKLTQPGIYALAIDDDIVVKRASQHPETRAVTLTSDNSRYPPIVLKRPENIHVVGRVFAAISRK